MLRVPLALVLAAGLGICGCSDDKSGAGSGGSAAVAKTPEERFQEMDTNGDGKVSLEEYKEDVKRRTDPSRLDRALQRAESRFKEIDKNHDGFISLEEYKNAPSRHGRYRGT